MTCDEAREYLFAFLDSELDAALSIEVQRHIERCGACAREAEIEREIRRGLERVLVVDAGEKQVRQTADVFEVFSRRERRGGRPLPWGRRLRLGAILSAAAVIVLAVLVRQRFGANDGGAATFADWLVEDFQHFHEEGGEVQFASGDPRVVSAWLRAQTALPVEVPASGEFRLLGGRKCKREGAAVAFAAYTEGGAAASVVALPMDDAELSSMRWIEEDGHAHWVDRCKGHTIVACRRGELVYAAVSTLPEGRLLSLMDGAPRAPDRTEERP